MRRDLRSRPGVTLIELLVVLMVLGVMAGVAGVAAHLTRQSASSGETERNRIAAARRQAIVSGRDVSITVVLEDRARAVTARADGRVLADSMPALDALGGRFTLAEPADARP